MTIFQGMVCWTTKMNIIFSMGNGVPNMALKFFPQKPPYGLNESQETSFEGTFSPISVVRLDWLFPKKKNRVHPWMDLHQPCEFYENCSKLLQFSRFGGFWGKNFKAVFGTPFPIEKIIFNFVVRHPIFEKWSCAPTPQKKIIFRGYFGKNFFFLKKLLHEKYLKPYFLQKSLLLIFVDRHPFPSKWSCPNKWFFTIFST